MKISNATAIAACNAIVDLLDGGTLRIYDGTQPADPDTAVSTQNILSEHTLGTPAFGAASDGNPGGEATANAIADDTSANNTGTATWFRISLSGGAAAIDGTAGTSGTDLIIDDANIVSGQTVKVNSCVLTMPES